MSVAALARRACVAPLLAVACGAAPAHDDEAAAAARIPQRVALLARAQAELEHGDAVQALDDFERAAMMLHAADAELGLIRAAMQDGQYRRALAFCAHTAGGHTDDVDGAALYAWLLRVGGQDPLARRVLTQARSQAPDDAIAAAVTTAFEATPLAATGLLLQPRHRMAPWPVSLTAEAAPPAAARFAGNAVLVGDGRAALLPATSTALATGARVWLRNGLGQASEAIVEPSDAALAARGLARLALRVPLPVGASREAAGRAPFAGSPGYAVRFEAVDTPAWPLLVQGFLGGTVGDTSVRKLGFDAAPGAPVLDARGALIGITVAPAAWLPLAALAVSSGADSGHATGLVAPDEIYEAGLRRALQVLVEPSR